MSKINLGTFKKIFNVKKGGAEFFRLVFKIAVWLFVMFAIFYGLILAPMEQTAIQKDRFIIDTLRVKRGCEVAANQQTLQAKAVAEKNGQKVNKEDEIVYSIQMYNQCVALQGRDDLLAAMPKIQPRPQQAQAQAQAPKQDAPKVNIETETVDKKETKK